MNTFNEQPRVDRVVDKILNDSPESVVRTMAAAFFLNRISKEKVPVHERFVITTDGHAILREAEKTLGIKT